MAASAKQTEEKKKRILAVARQLIQETGDFDLPMRKLAAQAQVSLRTPYEMFGSKAGVIGALMVEDQQGFRQTTRALHSTDDLENLFDRIRTGMDFYAENEPFYRAVFLATEAYIPGHKEEPARQAQFSFAILTRRAKRSGLIRPEIDTVHLGDTLGDIFAANVRTWARDELDLKLVRARISYGFAIILAGVTPEPVAARMREHIIEHQSVIASFDHAETPTPI